jgi:hypothetical protein
MDKIIFGVCIFAFGFLMGLDVNDAQAKRETDIQKQERLAKHKAVRLETEARYAACLRSCL